MLSYPNIDPVLFSIGPLAIRWYGLMYIAGFLAAYLLIPRQTIGQRLKLQGVLLQDLLLYLLLGLVIGARMGYLVFYQYAHWLDYLRAPLSLVALWEGGMSFHGGLLGCVAGIIIFCRKHRLPFWEVSDAVVVVAPIGLALGRIGNFINGELYGRISTVPWAMVFPSGGPWPRHPSQIYQALTEGVLLFVILWVLQRHPRPPGQLGAAFLLGYGLLRFLTEFFREPDIHIGLLAGVLSMGQVLCLGMMGVGMGLWWWRRA